MSDVEKRIKERLKEIEVDHGIRVMLAVESGSRAWGFPSPDSDYDVRFVYAHKLEWYLSIEEESDAIDLPIEDDLDFVGWDLRKTLRLFSKSHPSLIGWLASPIVYREDGTFATSLRALAQEYYSPKACGHHFLRIAESNLKEHFADPANVIGKKYFYVLRPLLNILWLSKNDCLPPMSFQDTLAGANLPRETREAIDNLTSWKKAATERATLARASAIDDWINEVLPIARSWVEASPSRRPPMERLNELFRSILMEAYDGQTGRQLTDDEEMRERNQDGHPICG